MNMFSRIVNKHFCSSCTTFNNLVVKFIPDPQDNTARRVLIPAAERKLKHEIEIFHISIWQQHAIDNIW